MGAERGPALPLIRQRVRSFRQHLFFFRLFYECPRLRPRLATNTSVTLSKPPVLVFVEALVEICRLNASRRAFRPLSTQCVRKAQRAKSLRVAGILANQSTPECLTPSIPGALLKYRNLSPQREDLSGFCLFCPPKSPKVRKMGIKSLQNLLFIPIFTYKLMKNARPSMIF